MSPNALKEVVSIVCEYAEQYDCSIEESINDLEFDGPNGSYGPSECDRQQLREYFSKKELHQL